MSVTQVRTRLRLSLNSIRHRFYFPFDFRYRLSEISFVLKAVATLIISMKKAPPAKGISSNAVIKEKCKSKRFFFCI